LPVFYFNEHGVLFGGGSMPFVMDVNRFFFDGMCHVVDNWWVIGVTYFFVWLFLFWNKIWL